MCGHNVYGLAMEKATEHAETLFVLLVDQKKAYNSISQQAFMEGVGEVYSKQYLVLPPGHES